MYELSLDELESELSAELPERSLMCCRRRRKKHHRHHAVNNHGGSNGTSANNGSVANSNSTKQVIFNPQVAIVTGVNGNGAGVQGNGALITQAGLNSNSNTNTQFGVPVNFVA